MAVWPSSLRFRLTFWYAAMLTLPLVAFAAVSYAVFSAALISRSDQFMNDALTAFARELQAERRVSSTLEAALQTTTSEVRFRNLHIVILDSTRRVVASTEASRAEDPDNESSPGAAERAYAALRADAGNSPAASIGEGYDAYRVLTRPLEIRSQVFTIAAAYPLRDIAVVLARIRSLFAIAIPLLVLIAAGGGYLLARRSLSPVAAMAARAAEITEASLHERLPVGGGEELVGLARVVNALLDRIESSFTQQRRFMADASHELRTPTAILRTEADVTLSRTGRAEEEYRASFTVIRDAGRRLTRIVDDLFLLARADSGHLTARRDQIDLEEVVHDAVRGVRHVAEARSVRVSLDEIIEAPFSGDADLLGRVVLNLLDNAIRYSPEGGTVQVRMARNNGRYEVVVADSGQGIPADAQSRVFERFFRADPARARAEATTNSGAGLGLAIGRRIAEMHGGSLELVQSRPGLTEFRVALPA